MAGPRKLAQPSPTWEGKLVSLGFRGGKESGNYYLGFRV